MANDGPNASLIRTQVISLYPACFHFYAQMFTSALMSFVAMKFTGRIKKKRPRDTFNNAVLSLFDAIPFQNKSEVRVFVVMPMDRGIHRISIMGNDKSVKGQVIDTRPMIGAGGKLFFHNSFVLSHYF